MRNLLVLALLATSAAADGVHISGTITGPDGKPSPGADFGAEWNNRGGKLLPLQTWKPGADGGYANEIFWIKRPMALVAMDAARKNGAMVVLEEKDITNPLKIDLKMAPLAEVSGVLACPTIGPSLGTTTIIVEARPSGARVVRMTLKDDKFTVPLPPGEFEALAVAYDAREFRKPFKVEDGGKPVDLGTLELEPTAIAKAWGKAPPAFAATSARGTEAGVKLTDLKGKWVLVVFWGSAMDDATRVIFPRLKDLLARRKDDVSKFAILALHDPTAKTWAEYDAKIAKVKAGPWGGEDPPFPVLLDSTGETWKAWGIETLPVMVLIDPDGNVVRAGNDRMLEEKLNVK
ncbi:MAG: TlpA disulfide reductase family protein [Planctomycetota bacterium]